MRRAFKSQMIKNLSSVTSLTTIIFLSNLVYIFGQNNWATVVDIQVAI